VNWGGIDNCYTFVTLLNLKSDKNAQSAIYAANFAS